MSSTIPIFSFDGTAKSEGQVLPEQWLDAKPLKPGTIAQVAVALQSHGRPVLAHTKTRGEVSGGGRKPWKQKGTGRARQGSIRSPQWKGGGVVFGPRNNRNYFLNINKAMVRRAFAQLLKEHATEGGMAVLETNGGIEPKTNAMAKTLKKLSSQWKPSGPLMMVVGGDADANVRRMTRNLKECALTDIAELGVLDLLKYPAVLFTHTAFDQLAKRTTKK
ncbi:50S ribosomal protein L4 [Candidatus Uhrbacteria bacterium]|nr:50S ribosomal protein L4 [Candidatus Uhrbacteria bacterium]